MSVTGTPRQQSRWWRSFYWRMSVGFVVFVIGVILAQSLMFSYAVSRSRGPFAGRSPDSQAATVAAELESALVRDPALDLAEYLRGRRGGSPMPIAVVMKDGRTASTSSRPLSPGTLHSVERVLAGTGRWETSSRSEMAGQPFAMAPIEVAGELGGLVVIPPLSDFGPPPRFLGDLWRVLSLPGTSVMLVATALAAFFIFGPARRRLHALEEATDRLGAGDLSARAPESGGDEIARVAWAFNRMATELAARDEAVRESDRLRRQMFADVSHELKTPLTAIRGYLETLRMPDVTLDGPTRDRYLSTEVFRSVCALCPP